MTEMKDDAFHDAQREQRLTLCTSGLFPYHCYILKYIRPYQREHNFMQRAFIFMEKDLI